MKTKTFTILMAAALSAAVASVADANTVSDDGVISVPYFEGFDSSDGATLFTVIDANNDSRTWAFNNSKKAMRYRGHSTNDADDWLLTAPIAMDASKRYEVSYATFVLNNNSTQDMTVHFGQGDDHTTMAQVGQNLQFSNEGSQTSTILLAPTASGNYRIAFHAVSKGGEGNFFVDDIAIREVYARDLSVALPQAATVKAGEPAEVVATVSNIGYEQIGTYTVSLYAGEQLVETKQCSTLEAGATAEVTFDYPTRVTDPASVQLTAIVTLDGDVDPANNTSEPMTLTLNQPTYPIVTDLAAENNGGVKLSWTTVTPDNSPVTDSFEDYTSWVIDGIGDWLTVDVDKARTMNITDTSFPYMGKAMAYLTFVPEDIGFEEYYPAHTGRQCLVSFDAVSHDAPQGSDDWLISPALSGKAQTINFWHRALYPVGGEDKYQVWYSTSNRKIASFTQLGETVVSPGEWTQAQAALPEGAKYFAIRCVSDADEIAFMLDDVTYEPVELVVAGYNVYRDGELLAFVEATDNAENTFIDMDNAPGEHHYQVSVVYTVGESALSESVTATLSGIADITGKVADAPYDVFTMDGRQVRRQATSLQGLKGMYIVNNHKVVIR